MLRIVCIVYLLSLANGLALLALDGMLPPVPSDAAQVPEVVELRVLPGGLLEGFSMLLVGAAIAAAILLQRWQGHF
jgi:hypothetical protein